MKSGLDGTKESYRINKTKILEKLLCSIIERTESEGLETNDDIEKLPNDVKDPDDAAKLISRMDKMVNIKKNKTLTIARKQGEICQKFNTDNKFMSAVKKFKISKATINFKIGIVEFVNMYPRMEKSGISLYYLKNNFKIKKFVKKMLLNLSMLLRNVFDHPKIRKRAFLFMHLLFLVNQYI